MYRKLSAVLRKLTENEDCLELKDSRSRSEVSNRPIREWLEKIGRQRNYALDGKTKIYEEGSNNLR